MPHEDNLATSLSRHLEKRGMLNSEGLRVPVIIKNSKHSYGVTRYFVTPVDGAGEIWVNESRVRINA